MIINLNILQCYMCYTLKRLRVHCFFPKHYSKDLRMNCKNLTHAVEVQYKYVEFSKKFRWENWTTLTNYKDSWHSNITVVAWEQVLLFRRARGRGKESLQRSLINFHLYFAQMKGNTISWKVTFRKSKLIDNMPSWPALNFRGNVSPKPLLCRG